jgi:rhodanese-related sulfurtransferase
VRADPDLLIVDTRSADEREQYGYSSSLAAALLVELGVDAGDLIGGYEAW